MPKITPRNTVLAPFWQTTDGKTVRMYHGHVIEVLKRLPPKSVHCVVTSPPYWGLRDYGTAKWEGGDPNCKHKMENVGTVQYLDRSGKPGNNNTRWQGAKGHATVKLGDTCKHCGALRVEDKQLGSEPCPDCKTWGQAQCGNCHVCNIVAVFREVHRVLRDDGTLWLNYGDSYSGGSGGYATTSSKQRSNQGAMIPPSSGFKGLTSGNLVGIPWRVALALQSDGWILRQDIIWHKPAPMPESVKNRCTKAHEYVFLFVKKQGYFYDAEAIKTPAEPSIRVISGKSGSYGQAIASGKTPSGNGVPGSVMRTGSTSNKRSVWTVSSQGYAGAHFATFPEKLITPMILAGTSAHGCCTECETPWKRVVEERTLTRERPNDYVKRTGEEGTGNSCSNSVAGVEAITLGWEPTCKCDTEEVKPCTVLDPFLGSGTTAVVAVEHDRYAVGCDLSEKYLINNAIKRVEGLLLSRPALRHLAHREAKKVLVGVSFTKPGSKVG